MLYEKYVFQLDSVSTLGTKLVSVQFFSLERISSIFSFNICLTLALMTHHKIIEPCHVIRARN